MAAPLLSAPLVRFGDFELDRGSAELRRNGTRVPLPEQPFRLLDVLLEHRGAVVSRDLLRERLWAADTFVDFEHGLNAAVRRLRDALGDSADQPRYIETVPRRGYRFIAAVDPTGGGITPTTDAAPTWRLGSAPSAAIVGALAAIVIGAWWFVQGRGAIRTEPGALNRLTRLTFAPGLQTDATFSPDGRFMAYASNASGNFDIWLQRMDGGPPVQLTDDPANDIQPDWAPNGRSLLFRSERDGGGIFEIAPDDRHVTRRTRSGFGPRWSPDGQSFVYGSGPFTSGTTFIASADATSVTPVAYQNEPGALGRAIGWNPDGRLVWLRGSGERISMVWRSRQGDSMSASPIDAEVGRRCRDLELEVVDNQRLVWSGDGRTAYFVGRANDTVDVWSLTVDPVTTRVTGGPARVTAGPDSEFGLVAAPRGGLAFTTASRSIQTWVMTLDASGRLVEGSGQAVTPDTVTASDPELSPDGQRLIVRLEYPGGQRRPELREFSIDNRTDRVLRSIDNTREDVRFPRWSPDGRRISYSVRRFSSDRFDSAVKVLDVGTLEESYLTSPWTDTTVVLENPWGWSADGRSIFVSSTRYRTGVFALARVPLSAAPNAETSATVLVAVKEAGVWQATETPNGRWVCYNQASPGSEHSVLHLVAADGGDPRPILSDRSWDDKPRWSADGQRLYFLSIRDGNLNVWMTRFDPGAGRTIGTPEPVTRYRGPGDAIVNNIGFSVGGSRLALLIERPNGGVWMLE